LPGNAIVVNHAPQFELLQRASVCITHAGLNTVLECLLNGVPQVAIPVTHDQPGVAARIADKKTGLVMPLKDLNASRLGLLLDEALTHSMYRENARYFQKSLAEYSGLSVAAELLENAFGLTKASDNSAKQASARRLVLANERAGCQDSSVAAGNFFAISSCVRQTV